MTLFGMIHGKPLNTVELVASELELALTTVQDVVDRNADGSPAEDSYIGVNLGLYVQRSQDLLRALRTLAEKG